MRDDNKNTADDDLDVFAKALPDDLPVHPALTKTMNVDLIVNKNAQVWLAHDQPFPAPLQWAEYDVDLGRLSIVTNGGVVQDLGIPIHKPMRKYLRQAKLLDTVLVKDKKIHDFGRIPLLVRESVN
jgi:hypothetical protein